LIQTNQRTLHVARIRLLDKVWLEVEKWVPALKTSFTQSIGIIGIAM
jgi:hypothetical protein